MNGYKMIRIIYFVVFILFTEGRQHVYIGGLCSVAGCQSDVVMRNTTLLQCAMECGRNFPACVGFVVTHLAPDGQTAQSCRQLSCYVNKRCAHELVFGEKCAQIGAYARVGDRCYTYVALSRSFSAANDYCKTIGADTLEEPESSSQISLFINVTAFVNTNAGLSLLGLKERGRKVYLSNENEITVPVEAWDTDQPDDYGGIVEECLAIAGFHGYKFNDIPCNYLAHFICQYE